MDSGAALITAIIRETEARFEDQSNVKMGLRLRRILCRGGGERGCKAADAEDKLSNAPNLPCPVTVCA